MALSPNYQWAEPDNSSLVKNGAQDIRALGDAIDTSVWNVGYGQAGKNKIINGNFGVWQRGTSFTNPAIGDYIADRFIVQVNGSGATRTYSQQTFTPGTAPVAGYEGTFFLRYARTVAGTGATADSITQRIEDVRTFAGQTATLSFWAKVDSGTPTLTLQARQNFGSGGSAIVTTDVNVTLSTSWTRYTATFAIGSVSGKTIGTNSYLDMQFRTALNTVQTLDLWGVQMEYGSKATPFQLAGGGDPQSELAMCQRYFIRLNSAADSGATLASSALNYSATAGLAMFSLPVPLRVYPTSITFSGTRYVDANLGVYTGLSYTIGGGINNNVRLDFTATGMTTGRSGWITQNGSTSDFIALNAELQDKMDKINFIEVDGNEHAIIENADGSFTSMLKSTHDELKANEATAL